MDDFEKLLNESVRTHGHLCPGQVLGVRMAMKGCKEVSISDPRGVDRKRLYVFVEIDRCATDAIQSVTGCSLGKRSLKWMDYGIMAATFVNLGNFKAVRIIAKEEAKKLAHKYAHDIEGKYEQQIEAYKVMPEDELFKVEEVMVEIPPEDMPGKPLSRIKCDKCGDYVQDKREVIVDGKNLCKPCA
ncbi:MAG: FmdE family protein, partial [Nitrospirota bacterium]